MLSVSLSLIAFSIFHIQTFALQETTIVMDDITKVLLRRLQTMRSEIQFMESVISGEADFQTSERH